LKHWFLLFMEAKELRIGNYFMYAGNNGIVYEKVSAIQYNTFGFLSNLNGTNYGICKPIKLTDELIFKCGGKKAEENDSYGGIIIYYPNGNGMRIKNNEWSSNHISVKIEYLHQLQNLYFALTNQELEVGL